MSDPLVSARVFITGGAGFVGSYVIEQLLKRGVQEIVVFDNLIRGSKENIGFALSDGRVRLIEGDIRDRTLLNHSMAGADFCFHLAAMRITHCAAEPRQALEVMYDGTFNVLEACVRHHVQKLVFASSASVYGQADRFPTTEDHPPYNNLTLYGAAKAANELMLRSFAHMCGLKYVALRFFNIYGPRMDVFGKYTEVLIRWYHLIREGEPPCIFRDGSQTMDFIYVEDVARSCLFALRADVHDEIFNVASGCETSLEHLCQVLLKVMGAEMRPEYIALPEERKNVEVMRRWADVSRAQARLGFKAEVGLEEGLSRLVRWLDKAKSGGK